MKKEYVKPSMEVYNLEPSRIICSSGNGEGGYLPTIPGQPDDEKKLA